MAVLNRPALMARRETNRQSQALQGGLIREGAA